MKKISVVTVSLFLSMSILSCKKNKKDDPQLTPAPAPAAVNELFIKFNMDGTAKSFTGATASMNQGFGGGSFTTSGFFNMQDDISINLSMPLDSIMGSDLQSLAGQKIKIGSCGGCPTNIHLDYDLNGTDYTSSDVNNALPNEYIKFNSVTFDKNVTVFDKKLNQYYITGEFNLKLTRGTDVKNLTNGTFGLIFRESKH